MDRRSCAAVARTWLDRGRTVAIEYRRAEERNERYTEIAAEFVRLKVEVITRAELINGSAGLRWISRDRL